MSNQTAHKCLTPQEARSTPLRCALKLSAVAVCCFLTSLHPSAACCVVVYSAVTNQRFYPAAACKSRSACQPAVTYTERLQAGQGFGDWKLWKSVIGKTYCHWTHMCHQSSFQSKCCEESAGLVFSHLLSCQELCTCCSGMHQSFKSASKQSSCLMLNSSLDCRLSI
jgi:hypothetical protein